MEQTVGRDGQPLPALSGTPQTAYHIPHCCRLCSIVCDLQRSKLPLFSCISDFEMGIGDTMTLGKLGTQAERDRRMKKK